MEILGIGPLELFFILIIALIVLGPSDMVKAGRTLGKWLRKLVKSDAWHTMQQTSQNLRELPTRLMREAGLEEDDLRFDRNQMGKIVGWEDLKKDLTVHSEPLTIPPDHSNGVPPDEQPVILPSPPPPQAPAGAIPYETPGPQAVEPEDSAGNEPAHPSPNPAAAEPDIPPQN